MAEKLFLLDGHSLAHRAFYALPLLQNSAGEYTNAVYGFARMLFRLIEDEQPDYMIVAFDTKAPTFRHQEYVEYKGNRKETPDELRPQFALIRELLEALNIKIISKEGFEADDLIGTLARKGEKEGLEVRIVTGDRDTLQLVSEKINVLYTRRGITELERYDLAKIKEEYQLEPDQLKDMKGLMGDSSDNIPGVPGIGEKTAIALLKEFSSLENLLANIDKVSGKKRKENLQEYGDQARLSKLLGTIVIDVPLEYNLADSRLEEVDKEALLPLLERLEFKSLLEQFAPGTAGTARKEFALEEIDFQELEETDEEKINAIIRKIEAQKEMALDFLLDNYKYPVSARVESFLLALNNKEVYSLPFTEKILKLFSDIFSREEIKKYILHGKETFIVLKKKSLDLKGFVFDPLLAAYLLNPSDNLPSLEEQVEKELKLSLPADSSVRDKNSLILSRLFEMKDILVEKLKNDNLYSLYRELEIPLVEVLAELEVNGVKIDTAYLEILSEKWARELELITEKIHKLAGEEFNINSPKQLGVILFEKLGLPVVKKTKTGYSTDAEVLEELKDKHEIIGLIMKYRQLAKLKSTYVDALPPLVNKETGRLHTSFNQMVTATGRLSSTDPNLQNIPIRTAEGREIRKAFISENEDWLLLSADYSQIELRVLAHISGDENLIRAFNNNADIHNETASEIFGVRPDEVTPDMRRHAKVINFGIAYGMSSFGLATDLGISRNEAEAYIEKYFQRFSGVKKYMDEVVEKARKDGFVTTILNRRRHIPDINSRNFHRRNFARRTAINTPIQGSAADLMKKAMLNVYNKIKTEKYRARILLQVHDELVLEVHREDLKELAEVLKREMEKVVELKVPLVVEVQVAENWKDQEDYTEN
ncbi:MAG TPA: DNA polymerase I [Halanaerobiaceae bacterium]|nr:DNA polymerase I [Halanaerobiaceae bacterium]